MSPADRSSPTLEKGASDKRTTDQESIDLGEDSAEYDLTHRKLKARHIQLIGIGGTIGTALFVQIGHGLIDGGPPVFSWPLPSGEFIALLGCILWTKHAVQLPPLPLKLLPARHQNTYPPKSTFTQA